ncbi:MAG: hypothetical protein ACTSPI_08500 [Candidatus Heimdallarchaeaceae archaeon]
MNLIIIANIMNEEKYPPKPPKPKKKPEKAEEYETKDVIDDIPQPKPIPASISAEGKDITSPFPPIFTTKVKEEKKETKKEKEKKEEKWSWLGWGLLFFFLWNIGLMFILELTLSPRDSLLATIIAYALGVLGLGIYSFLVRSKKKAILTLPLLLIIVFGAGFLFHFLNLPVYNPFAPISEQIPNLYASLSILSDNDFLPTNVTIANIMSYLQFAFVVDLVISLPVFIFGLLGLTWFVQIFTSKPRWLTILSVTLALVLFLIGIIISPLLHLIFAGLLKVGASYSMGIMNISAGVAVFSNFENATQADINHAIYDFTLAAEYIENSSSDFLTLSFLLRIIPLISKTVNDLSYAIVATTILLNGMGNFVNGTYQIFQGFKLVSEALNFSTSTFPSSTNYLQIKEQKVNDTQFDQAMNQINEGLRYLTNSSEVLESAITELSKVDFDEINSLITKIPANTSNLLEIIETMQTYQNLFSGVPEAISLLIHNPEINGTESRFSILSHFFYGARELVKASEKIGDKTAFNDTRTLLVQAYTNFSVVRDQLRKAEIQTLINSETPFLNDTLHFLYDMAEVTTSLTSVYIDLADSYSDFENMLTNFDQGYENISNYDEYITNAYNLVQQTNSLVNTSKELDNNITIVQNRANQSEYGLFSEPASEISTLFNELNITRDVTNTNSMAISFYSLFSSMEQLKITHKSILNGQEAFKNSNFQDAQGTLALLKLL